MSLKLIGATLLLLAVFSLPLQAQQRKQPQRPLKGQPSRNRPAPVERKAGNPSERMSVLEGLIGQLNLDEEQLAEVRVIAEEFRARLPQQPGGAGAAESAAARQKLVARYRNQGLAGAELRKAVEDALAGPGKSAVDGRPRETLLQQQADLIGKVREVLNEEQQLKLDELLRQQTQSLRTKRESGATGKGSTPNRTNGRAGTGNKSGKSRQQGRGPGGGR